LFQDKEKKGDVKILDRELEDFFMFFWLEPKEPKVQAKNKCSAIFGRPTHMDSYQDCKYIMTSN
jgi:hypothetical protein